MAGASRSASGQEAKRSCSSAQLPTRPGTSIESWPVAGIVRRPWARNQSIVAARGAGPLALIATTAPVCPSWTRANRSPPMVLAKGRTTWRTPLPAKAASTTLPPSCSTRTAISAASGWPAATMAWVPITIGRVAKGAAGAAGPPPGAAGSCAAAGRRGRAARAAAAAPPAPARNRLRLSLHLGIGPSSSLIPRASAYSVSPAGPPECDHPTTDWPRQCAGGRFLQRSYAVAWPNPGPENQQGRKLKMAAARGGGRGRGTTASARPSAPSASRAARRPKGGHHGAGTASGPAGAAIVRRQAREVPRHVEPGREADPRRHARRDGAAAVRRRRGPWLGLGARGAGLAPRVVPGAVRRLALALG